MGVKRSLALNSKLILDVAFVGSTPPKCEMHKQAGALRGGGFRLQLEFPLVEEQRQAEGNSHGQHRQ